MEGKKGLGVGVVGVPPGLRLLVGRVSSYPPSAR